MGAAWCDKGAKRCVIDDSMSEWDVTPAFLSVAFQVDSNIESRAPPGFIEIVFDR